MVELRVQKATSTIWTVRNRSRIQQNREQSYLHQPECAATSHIVGEAVMFPLHLPPAWEVKREAE